MSIHSFNMLGFWVVWLLGFSFYLIISKLIINFLCMAKIFNLGLLVTLPLLFELLESRSGINSQIRFELHKTRWIHRSINSILGWVFVQCTERGFYPKCWILMCRISCSLSWTSSQPSPRIQNEDVIFRPCISEIGCHILGWREVCLRENQ